MYTAAGVSASLDASRFFFECGTGKQSIYYDNGEIRATGYVNSDSKIDGKLIGYREDGSLRYEAMFWMEN